MESLAGCNGRVSDKTGGVAVQRGRQQLLRVASNRWSTSQACPEVDKSATDSLPGAKSATGARDGVLEACYVVLVASLSRLATVDLF